MCVCVAAAAAPAPVFDEDSVASLSALQDETRDGSGGGGGVAENGVAANLPPFQGGYMLAASYWPKVRRPPALPAASPTTTRLGERVQGCVCFRG